MWRHGDGFLRDARQHDPEMHRMTMLDDLVVEGVEIAVEDGKEIQRFRRPVVLALGAVAGAVLGTLVGTLLADGPLVYVGTIIGGLLGVVCASRGFRLAEE
jgi:uncharacterized membrane protein